MLRIIDDRIVSAFVVALATLALASCGESKPAAPSPFRSAESTVAAPISQQATIAAPASEQRCSLVSDRDLIEWKRSSHPPYSDGSTGRPASAIEIGDVDLVNCKSYLDGWVANHEDNEADTAAGYRDCYEIAWADDNPGYNADAVPAPRLKNVIEQAGNAC
jgi:hypothetical protein